MIYSTLLLLLILLLVILLMFRSTEIEPFGSQIECDKNLQNLKTTYDDLKKEYDKNYQILLDNYNSMISTMNKSVDGNEKAKSVTSQLNATIDVPL